MSLEGGVPPRYLLRLFLLCIHSCYDANQFERFKFCKKQTNNPRRNDRDYESIILKKSNGNPIRKIEKNDLQENKNIVWLNYMITMMIIMYWFYDIYDIFNIVEWSGRFVIVHVDDVVSYSLRLIGLLCCGSGGCCVCDVCWHRQLWQSEGGNDKDDRMDPTSFDAPWLVIDTDAIINCCRCFWLW